MDSLLSHAALLLSSRLAPGRIAHAFAERYIVEGHLCSSIAVLVDPYRLTGETRHTDVNSPVEEVAARAAISNVEE